MKKDLITEVNITKFAEMLSEEYNSYEKRITQLETVLLSIKSALIQVQKHSNNTYIDFACKQSLKEIEDVLKNG